MGIFRKVMAAIRPKEPSMPSNVGPELVGCWFQDAYGVARVMAVAEGYLMMRRLDCTPFVVSGLMLGARWKPVEAPE